MNILKKLFSGLISTAAVAVARHAATFLGGIVLTWLLDHHVGGDYATRLVGNLTDTIMTLTGVGLAAAGVTTSLSAVVGSRNKAAAIGAHAYDAGVAAGQAQGVTAQADADQDKADAVKAAMADADAKAPKDMKALLAQLRTPGAP